MSEFSFSTSKGEMFKAMLKRPETAKLIKEALASPLGSTSRVKAKKIFSIMNKLNEHNSGMGGPGNMFYQPQPQESRSFDRSNDISRVPKGMVVFNRIPKSRISYGKPVAPQQSNTQVLNNMVKYNTMPGQSTLPNTVGTAVARNNLMGTAPKALKTGMGGPGYDGRGGFFSNVWEGIKNTASSAWDNLSKAGEAAYNNPMFNQSVSSDYGQVKSTAPSNNNQNVSGFSSYLNPYSEPSAPVTSQPTTNWWDNSPATQNNWWKPTAANNTTDYSKLQSSASNPTPVVDKNGVADWSQTTVKPNAEQVAYWAPYASNDPLKAPSTAGQNNTPKTSLNENLPEFPYSTANEVSNLPANNVTYIPNEDGSIHVNVNNGELGGECGTFVNNYLGNERPFGDAYYGEGGKQSMINSKTPQVGSIAVIPVKSGPLSVNGHVAVVERVNGDGTIDIVESNGNGSSKMIGRKTISLNDVDGFYIPGQPPSGTNLAMNSDAQAYVNANTGPTAYGLDKAKQQMGGSLQDVINKNREDIFAQFNINQQNAEIQRMTAEGVALPRDLTNYIKERDTYIEQTDKEIDAYISDVMAHSDMSNPANIAKANAQLGYLYELRGEQNQTYIGYLNQSIDQHTEALNVKVTKYNSDLEFAQDLLDDTNAISVSDYENMVNSFGEMYTEVKNAPLEAMQNYLTELEVIKAEKEAGLDGSNYSQSLSNLEQYNELKPILLDENGNLRVDIDLTQELEALNQYNDPNNVDIDERGIVSSYQLAVRKYLSTANDPEKGVTMENKLKVAKKAVENLEKLSYYYQDKGRSTEANAAIEQANENKAYIVDQVSSQILASDKIDAIKTQIKVSPEQWNWFGLHDKIANASLKSEDKFVSEMNSATGGSLDDSIAKAIYAAIVFATKTDEAGINRQGINQLFYPSSGIQNASNESMYDLNNPFNDVEFARKIGEIALTSY